MSVSRGDVIHMKNFKHSQPGLEVSYKANPDKVAVFLLLGHASRNSPGEFNPEKALNELGWLQNTGVVQQGDLLLKVLKSAVESHEHEDYPPSWVEDARRVIAAATGAA